MLKLFDYIYYRYTRLYKKNDYDWKFSACVSLAFIQMVLIFMIEILILRTVFSRLEISEISKLAKIFGVIVCIFLLIFNYIRYSNIFYKLEKKWENESKSTRKKRGYLVVSFIITLFTMLFLVAGYLLPPI
jgi:hypothetical protein